jgi:hypothetical protein
MRRVLWIGVVAYAALSPVACSPELQPAAPPCNATSISYDEAPESFKTSQLEDAIAQYEALAGGWTADIVCPPDRPPARALDFAVETRPRREIEFFSGCGTEGDAVTSCQINLSGQDFPELSGQSENFDIGFLVAPYKVIAVQSLQPPRDSSLYSIWMRVTIEMDNTVSGVLTYGFAPYRNADGSMTQNGYDCNWTNARRITP